MPKQIDPFRHRIVNKWQVNLTCKHEYQHSPLLIEPSKRLNCKSCWDEIPNWAGASGMYSSHNDNYKP
eukprot:5456317-Amphidinium_carterae.1